MEKPILETKKAFNYEKCSKWVSEKLGYNIHDTLGSFNHYSGWCKLIGEKADRNSQEQCARYSTHPEGEIKRPEFRDYWRFLTDHEATINSRFEITDDLLENWQ